MQSSTLSKTVLLLLLFAAACSRSESAPAPAAVSSPASAAVAAPPASPDEAGHLRMEVTDAGFVPVKATVQIGKPLTLSITRKVQRTCATDIVISDYQVNKPLPLNETVEITFTPQKPGKIHFGCAMDMLSGDLTAE